jgi:hypothetical protein
LQVDDCINERGTRPRFCDTLRLLQGNNVSRRFFNDAEAIELQLPKYRCFPCAGRSRQYKPFHSVPFAFTASMEC